MEPADIEVAPATAAPEPDPSESWAVWVKDQVEAFVIAFIIALVVRCFCLEVFKIPTGSMTPTLLGDHEEPILSGPDAGGSFRAGGDRIMVSKFMYRLFPLERFDVVVFKYPLDTSRNFIKRLVGLPNEKLMVQQGDLYVLAREEEERGGTTYRLARKPLRVQESIWIPVFPGRRSTRLEGAWSARPETAARFGADSVVLDAREAPGGEATLVFGRGTMDSYDVVGSGGANRVGDLRLASTVTLAGEDAAIALRIRSAPDSVKATVPVRGKGVLTWEIDRGRRETREFDSPLGDGRPHDVALLNYDGFAQVRIDGEAVVELSYREVREKLQRGESAASFHVSNGRATLEHITLHRDVYYLSRTDFGGRSVVHPEGTPIAIPDGCYFMMGDNSPGSKDSRVWDMKVFRLKDGTVLRADSSNVKPTPQGFDFRDEFGVPQHIREEDMAGRMVQAPPEEAVFVPEELIVGKAFYVWWPLGRMKLIR